MHNAGGPSASKDEGGEVYHTMVRSGDFCRNSSYVTTSGCDVRLCVLVLAVECNMYCVCVNTITNTN